MISAVSSTERVVCVTYATRSGSGSSTARACSIVSTSTIASGASAIVPTTSSWPA